MEKSEETRRKSPQNREDENLESEMKILTLVENTPIAMEKTIKKGMERLPLDVFSDEILLKIMGNLSTFDILRKIAQVSERSSIVKGHPNDKCHCPASSGTH